MTEITMTQALYLSDITQAEVEVLQCDPTEDGRFAIQLAQTPFHPQGGGQPSDYWNQLVDFT